MYSRIEITENKTNWIVWLDGKEAAIFAKKKYTHSAAEIYGRGLIATLD
jgi:hypothetical protein